MINNIFTPYRYKGRPDDQQIHRKIIDALIQNFVLTLNFDQQMKTFSELTSGKNQRLQESSDCKRSGCLFDGQDLVETIVNNTRIHINNTNEFNRQVIVQINTNEIRDKIINRIDNHTLSLSRSRLTGDQPAIPFLAELTDPKRQIRLSFIHNSRENTVKRIVNDSSGLSRKAGWLESVLRSAIEKLDDSIHFVLEGENENEK